MLIIMNKKKPKDRAQYLMKSICNIIFPLHERFSISEALYLTNS